MLDWDETDVLTVLEVIPEVETDGIWHYYTVSKDGMELRVTIYQYDGDVRFELYRDGIEKSIFSMQIFDCGGIVRKDDSTGEYLEFAPSKCSNRQDSGEPPFKYGVRLYVNPSINLYA